jgi:DNA-binding NtrC family response regulator
MKKKILIVDDEPGIVEILQDLLSSFTTYTAGNGKQALEQVKKNNPDLILSYVSMPEMTGIEMLKELRAQGFKTPIVFISAFGDVKNLRSAWKLGAIDFIDKPFSIEAIQTTVKMALMYQSDQEQVESTLANRANESTPRKSVSLSLSEEVVHALTSLASAKGLPISNLIEELLEKSLNIKK